MSGGLGITHPKGSRTHLRVKCRVWNVRFCPLPPTVYILLPSPRGVLARSVCPNHHPPLKAKPLHASRNPHVLTPLPSLPHHPRENYSLQFPPCIVLTSTYRRLIRVFSRAGSLDPNRDSHPKLKSPSSLIQVIRTHNKNVYKMTAILNSLHLSPVFIFQVLLYLFRFMRIWVK